MKALNKNGIGARPVADPELAPLLPQSRMGALCHSGPNPADGKLLPWPGEEGANIWELPADEVLFAAGYCVCLSQNEGLGDYQRRMVKRAAGFLLRLGNYLGAENKKGKFRPHPGPLPRGEGMNTPVGDGRAVVEGVCAYFGVRREGLIGRGRTERLVWPRHLAMLLLHEAGMAAGAIAELLRRGRTMVRWSVSAALERIAVEARFRRDYEAMRKILGEEEDRGQRARRKGTLL